MGCSARTLMAIMIVLSLAFIIGLIAGYEYYPYAQFGMIYLLLPFVIIIGVVATGKYLRAQPRFMNYVHGMDAKLSSMVNSNYKPAQE